MVARALQSSGPIKGRILLVEDHPDVRHLISLSLELDGHDVVEAETAEEGLQLLEAGHYDLVITDYALPGNTGAWMLRQGFAEGLLDDSALIILTAHPHPEPVDGVEIIRKPLDLDQFLGRIGEALARLRATSAAATSAPPPPPVTARVRPERTRPASDDLEPLVAARN